LCHVIEDDGLVDEISTRRDVDDSRGVRRRVTDPGTAAVAVGDGTVEGIGIIGDTIAFRRFSRIL
jgi:hypothetical protein